MLKDVTTSCKGGRLERLISSSAKLCHRKGVSHPTIRQDIGAYNK